MTQVVSVPNVSGLYVHATTFSVPQSPKKKRGDVRDEIDALLLLHSCVSKER